MDNMSFLTALNAIYRQTSPDAKMEHHPPGHISRGMPVINIARSENNTKHRPFINVDNKHL